MIEMLIILCLCHVHADLHICQSGVSFEHRQYMIFQFPHTIKVLFSNVTTCVSH